MSEPCADCGDAPRLDDGKLCLACTEKALASDGGWPDEHDAQEYLEREAERRMRGEDGW